MPRNIEIKARLAPSTTLAELTPQVAALATEGPFVLVQDDTFFACANGRLKLRVFGPETTGQTAPAELIFYRRADAAGPRESDYRISPCPDPDGMRSLLAEAQGQTGRVRKRRLLFRVGRTRVHLDAVEGLGEFLELEVVLRDGEPPEAGLAEARALMARLGIAESQLQPRAYVDLLAQAEAEAESPWTLDLADSELAALTPDGAGGLRLRLAVALLAPTPAARLEGAEPEHALGVTLAFDGVDGIDAAALAELTPGRIRQARVTDISSGRTLALPCPGALQGPLHIELQPAHGPALRWRARGLAVSQGNDSARLPIHAC